MALSLDATVSGASANSYATRVEGDTYHDAHLYASTWDTAEAWKKDAALIMATRLLDEQVDWYGWKYTDTQALRWPRSGVEDPDGDWVDEDTLPTFLKNATAELARWLIAEDRTAEPTRAMSRVRVEGIEIVYDKNDRKPILPPSVVSIVRPYGKVRGYRSMVELTRG